MTATKETSFAAAFPPLWLRDNCVCATCRDATSHQKLFSLLDLDEHVAIEDVTEEGDRIAIAFSDGHRSTFSHNWLREQARGPAGSGRTDDCKQLWRARDLDLAIVRATWTEYLNDEHERLRALRGIERLGFALFEGAPVTPGTVLEIAATFGFVRETNYGKLFDVRVEPHPSNLAFTGLAITPHTDNPYRDPVPTMQLLHCLSNSVEGGDSGLVDGFMAAAMLREEDPRSFDVLTRTPSTSPGPTGTTRCERDVPSSNSTSLLACERCASTPGRCKRYASVTTRSSSSIVPPAPSPRFSCDPNSS